MPVCKVVITVTITTKQKLQPLFSLEDRLLNCHLDLGTSSCKQKKYLLAVWLAPDT